MKKLVLLMAILFMANVSFAEEIQPSLQDVDVDASGAVFLLNKQPKTANNNQTIKVRRCGLVFVANINGKVTVQKEEKQN